LKCPDCHSKWGEMDMLLNACQGCGDPLFPEDVEKLRNLLGVSGPAPPEVEQPVIVTEPEDVPDSAECPECFTPLIGDDLETWVTLGTCNFCPATNPHQLMQAVQPSHPTTALEPSGRVVGSNSEQLDQHTPDGVSFFINNGPMAGETVNLPLGVSGRKDLSSILTDPWYEPHLGRISGEHFELTDDSELDGEYGRLTVKDLGSTNGTWLRGERLISTSGVPLGLGSDLNLGGNIQLSLTHSHSFDIAPTVQHIESKVKFAVEDNTVVHLGRQTESGQRERWAEMADLQLRSMGDDPDILAYLSRRHFTLTIKSPEIEIEVFEGKEEPEVVDNSDGSFLIRTRKNGFIVTIFPHLQTG